MKAAVSGVKSLIISIHDYHSDSLARIAKQIEWLDKRGINKVTILAIPNYHKKGEIHKNLTVVRFLQDLIDLGNEVALHGYYHLRTHSRSLSKLRPVDHFLTRIYTANEAEFYNISKEKALRLITFGLEIFKNCGIHPNGFVAPGWLISEDALNAVWETGFKWTCTLTKIINRGGYFEKTQTFCWSTREFWRVPVSITWNYFLWLKNSNSKTIRISLHPYDLELKAIRYQIQKIIDFFLSQNFFPRTYNEHLEKSLSMFGR